MLKRLDKQGELTPFLKNVLIVGSLFVAIFLVVIIVYNIVSLSSDRQASEESVELEIIKSSVAIGSDDVLKLSIKGDLGEEKLERIKFEISDGEKEKETILDASDFVDKKSYEINLKNLGIDTSKKVIVSIRPIIKGTFKNKELKITDRVSISPTGDVEEEEIEDIEVLSDVKKCEDCGGAFGSDKCSRLKCHSILESFTKCYYVGSWKRTCTICTDLYCGDYNSEEDCNGDRCSLDCDWDINDNKCVSAAECGDGDCTGDETYQTCSADCPAPDCEVEGATQACGSDVGECVAGTQTCTDGVWGDCGGTYVGSVEEICDGLDNDCDGEVDEGAGCTLDNGESCSVDGDCTSGNCVDDVCCGSSSCPTCQSCDISGSEGTCTNVADGTDPDDDCGGACVVCSGGACVNAEEDSQPDGCDSSSSESIQFCDGSGNCASYGWEYLGEWSNSWVGGVASVGCRPSILGRSGWGSIGFNTPSDYPDSIPTYDSTQGVFPYQDSGTWHSARFECVIK